MAMKDGIHRHGGHRMSGRKRDPVSGKITGHFLQPQNRNDVSGKPAGGESGMGMDREEIGAGLSQPSPGTGAEPIPVGPSQGPGGVGPGIPQDGSDAQDELENG